MTWINPLDLQTLLVNTLAGNYEIFIGLSLIFFAGMAAYFRMQNEIALVLIALFFVIMTPYIGNAYLIAVIIFATLLIYFAIARIVKN